MISQLISLYTLVIFVRIILSWFPVSPGGAFGQVNRVLYQITEPVLGPARRIIEPRANRHLADHRRRSTQFRAVDAARRRPVTLAGA